MTADFNENEKAMIRQIAWEVAAAFKSDLVDLVAGAVQNHASKCKAAQRVRQFVWIGVGMLLALSVLGISTLPKLWEFVRTAGAAGGP